ncbi:MAG: FGGY-family carbohydrate kinase [Acidimicrobiales bacterium]
MADDTTTTATGTKYVLAVDLGTGGPKVALVSTDGDVVAHEYERNELHLLPGGGAEQDPEEWWRTITLGMKHLVDRKVVPVDDIVAIAVSAQWMGTVAVDDHGNHLMDAVIWMDSRGAPHAKRVTGGRLAIPGLGYDAVKVRKWLSRTGGLPSRTGKDPVGHILWLKHERPDVYRQAHKLLDVPDYLNLRFTGRAAASYDTIVGYWCTDNRDLRRVDYDDELVALCGLDRDKLPDLLPTGSIVGPILPAVAAELGLGEHVQVVTGTGDTSSAGIGAGAVRDFDAHLYVGTSSWLSCHVPFKKTDLGSNITSLPSGIPERYWVATEQDVAGKCLTWLIDNVLYPDDELSEGEGVPLDILDRLNAMAARVPAGSENVMFLPWLNGERTPVDNHYIRGGWFNASLTTDRAHLVRSVLEGVALNTRWMLDAAEKFVRKERPNGFEHIAFIGGGANSALWCQIMADVLHRPIRQIADPVLANVRGAGFTAGVALGHLRWDDIPERIAVQATYAPDHANAATYDRLYETFVGFYKQTKGLSAKLNRDLYRSH